MQKKFLFLKTVSCILAALLFWGTLFPDASSAQTASVKLSPDLFQPVMPVPVKSARIEWHPALSGNSNGTVYLFQDAHSSFEAQQKISAALKEIGRVDLLYVEGAAGSLTRSRFQHKPGREMIETLEHSAYLNGASAFFLAHPGIQAQGLEEPALYRANFSAFRSVFESQKEIQRWLESRRTAWRQAAELYFPEKLAAYFLNTQEHHLRNPSLRYFYDLTVMAADELKMSWNTQDQIKWPGLFRVQRLIELEKLVDLEKARDDFDSLRKLFESSDWSWISLRLKADPKSIAWSADSRRLRVFAAEIMKSAVRRKLPLEKYRGFLNWLAFETLRAEINPDQLLDEAQKLEDKIAESAAARGAAQKWMQEGRWILLLDKAGRLELTRREYSLFRRMIADHAFKSWAQSQKGVENFLRAVQSFYGAAEKRDRVFAEKIQASLDDLRKQNIKQPRIAAVMGGYHKDAVVEFFRDLNVDVAVVTPNLEKADEEVAYLDAMLGSEAAQSTLAFTPAAVIRSETMEQLLGGEEAARHEFFLAEILAGRSEARHFTGRRQFLAGAAALLSAPLLAAGQDTLDSLLRDANAVKTEVPKSDLTEALFAVEPLKMNSQNGMEGYLPGIMSRVENNLPGIQLKWSRVLAEAQVMRANRISFMPSFSQSKGFQAGIQIAGMAGERLEISDGGLSIALKTIGLLLDEILVNPVRNQADAAAIQSAEFSYQLKKTRLAGEVVRLLVLLKMSEAKIKVTDAYISKLAATQKQVEQLVQAKAAGEEHLHAVTNYLNQAKDARGELEREIVQAREGMKIILGADFHFDAAKAPVPSREWLRAGRDSAAALAAKAKSRAGRAFDVQAAEAQAQAYAGTAKAEKRRGFFSFFFRRGPASPEKTMQNLNLNGPGLSSNPEAAQAQIHAEAVKNEKEMLLKNLEMLVSVETARFVTAREAHERWQRQVDEEQGKWRIDSSFIAAGYTLDMLARLKSFVHAQLRVMETRGEMSGASAAMMAAGLDEMGANSVNWAKPVLISDFFPEGYKPASFSYTPAKRSEIRSLFRTVLLFLVQALVFLQMASAQLPAVKGMPAAAAGAVSSLKTWEGRGVSPVSADESSPMHLKIPETVVLDAQGQLKLNPEAQQRYENLRDEFETGLKSYLHLKKTGAKPAELLPAFKLLLAGGLELDRLERILKALETAENPAFKILARQTGTTGAGQSVLELVSKRIAVVRAHIPLHDLLGSQIKIEIAGQAGTLISRPKILETDLAGAAGNVLVEIKAAVEKPLDLNSDQPFKITLEKSEGSVAQAEPAELILLSASGSEIPAGVVLLLREEIPLVMPEFGSAVLKTGAGAGDAAGGSLVASIPFERKALVDFLLRESAELGASIGEALQVLLRSSGFTNAQINVFKENSRIGEMTAKQIANSRDLASPADGFLSLSPELASGLSLSAGQTAASVRTAKIRAQTALAINDSVSAGDSVQAKLPDGRVLAGKIISISSGNQAQVAGRREVTVEFDVPPSAAELDWTGAADKNGLSPAFLFSLLAEAHQKPGQMQHILTEIELSGPAGAAAAAVQPSRPARPKTLAQLIAGSADASQALEDLKKHTGSFGNEDYQELLRSSQLSLVFETARFMIRDRSEWAGLMRAFAAAKAAGDLARIRAMYDGMTAALASGGPEIEAGLIRLGTVLRGDDELKKAAESVFAALLAERGVNDIAARRLLDSGLWTLPELNTFASGLHASSESAVKKAAGGIFELVWRLSADQQIASIKNSAFWEKMVSGRDPEHALNWLSPEDYLQEFIYRESLAADRRLLRGGILSTGGPLLPKISVLIDGKTAEKISISPESVPAPDLMPGILGARPVSLGEWDVMPVQDQEAAIRSAAARGEFELLTWILKSRASDHLKKTAAAALQGSEEGMLFFAGWFAEEGDVVQAESMIRSYGAERFMADMTARVSALQQQETAAHHSAAPERQILLRSLFKWYVWFKDSAQNRHAEQAVRLLMMLIPDPADLGKLARAEAPFSPEGVWIGRLPASVYQTAALQELWRRSAAAAVEQYPLYSRSQAIIGESRPGNTASESLKIASLLAPASFASHPPVRSGDAAAARGDLDFFFKAKISDSQAAGDIGRLAEGHFDAGYSGKVNVPSASGHNAGLMWTLFRYVLNFLGFVSLGLLTWVFWRQTLVRYKKLRTMARGEAVQFYDSIREWKEDFRMEIVNSGVIQEKEGKKKVIDALDQWSDELAGPRPDFSKIKILAEEAFNWPNFSLRLENFKGFRNDDRQRDRILAYALNSLAFLTLKRISEMPDIRPESYNLHEFLKGRSERLVIFSFILFQLKNLKENESYNAIEPNIANMAIQRERLKSYNFQRRVWKAVRVVYRLDKASEKIRSSIRDLIQGYADVSVKLGVPVIPPDIAEMQKISRTEYMPREHWGKSPDNSTISGDRKLASRIFTFLAAIASLPSVWAQVELIMTFYSVFSMGGWVAFGFLSFSLNAILLFSLFSYFSHLIANMSNLHDVQAEEYLNHLMTFDRIVQARKPEPVTASAPTLKPITVVPASPAPKAVLPPNPPAPARQPFNWQYHLNQWSADQEVTAVVVFVPSSQADREEENLSRIFNAGDRKFTKALFVDALDDLNEAAVRDRIQALPKEIAAAVPAGKIVFAAYENGSYRLLPETAKIAAAASEKKAKPAAGREARVEQIRKAKSLKDILAVMETELLASDEPGFDGVVVSVNRHFADEARRSLPAYFKKRLGFDVPVQVIVPPDVEHGNGRPLLYYYSQLTGLRQKMSAESPAFAAKINQAKPTQILFIEATSKFDFWNSALGSVMFAPVGVQDKNQREIRTGDAAAAYASLAGHAAWAPADSVFLANGIPEANGSDLTLISDAMPAKDVIGRYGVVLPKNPEKENGRVLDLIEKPASIENLSRVVGSRTKHEIEIMEDSLVQAFTGMVFFHFQEQNGKTAARREMDFQEIMAGLDDSWKNLSAPFQASGGQILELDKVYDLLIPIIKINTIRDYENAKSALINYASFRGRSMPDAARRIYEDFYLNMLNAFHSSGLRLKINHFSAEESYFADVREIPQFQRHVLNETPVFGQPRSTAAFPSSPFATRESVLIGSNGDTPEAFQKLEYKELFSVAAMRDGRKVRLFGAKKSFTPEQRKNLGICIQCILGNDMQPLYPDAQDIRDIPLFSTYEGAVNPQQADAEAGIMKALLDGRRVMAGSREKWERNRISLAQFEAGANYDPFASRLDPKSSVRAELRDLRSLAAGLRSGAIPASFFIFRGTLEAGTRPAVTAAAAKYEIEIMRWLYRVLREKVLEDAEAALPAAVPVLNGQQTLFVDGRLLSGREAAIWLESFSRAPFRIEILYTQDQHEAYERAVQVLKGKSRGSLYLRRGAALGEMIQNAASRRIQDNPDQKYDFAFAGRDAQTARRMRQWIGNLVSIEDEAVSPALLLEALTSPAVFALAAPGRQNRIWTWEKAMPLLLSAARRLAAAA